MTDPKQIKAEVDSAYVKYLRGEISVEQALAIHSKALSDLCTRLAELTADQSVGDEN